MAVFIGSSHSCDMRTLLVTSTISVPPAMFDELLKRLGPRITKKDTRYRKVLKPGLKLDFRVPYNTVSFCVR
jgi:hypothetical protein